MVFIFIFRCVTVEAENVRQQSLSYPAPRGFLVTNKSNEKNEKGWLFNKFSSAVR